MHFTCQKKMENIYTVKEISSNYFYVKPKKAIFEKLHRIKQNMVNISSYVVLFNNTDMPNCHLKQHYIILNNIK